MANEEVSQPETRESIGQKLKRAREQRGLSETDVANAQHLRTGVIQAIEAGEYKKIDSELFLKGYVRAYARMVGLDADQIIRDLDQELEPLRVEQQQAVESNPLVGIERRREKKRRVARGFFYTAMVALAGYLVFAFVLPKTDFQLPTDLFSVSTSSETEGEQSEDNTAEPAPVEAETPDSEPTNAANVEPASDRFDEADVATEGAIEPVPADSGQGDEAAMQPQAVEETEIESVDQEVEQQELVEPASVAGPDVADEALAVEAEATEVPQVSEVENSVQVDEPAEDVSEVQQSGTESVESVSTIDEPAVQVSVGAIATLEISFTGDCWVQVSDASGDRLVSALRRSGDRLELTGDAPMRVVIGAVDAVSAVQFNGQPVDLGNFRVVNNRSEFTLPR